MNAAARRHPEAKIGDTFGPFTVTATMPRGHKGRSDERVEWKCTCGRWGESYVFNLRKAKDECRHAGPRRVTKTTPKPREARSFEAMLVDGVEGLAIYLNGYRIAGPKPWGGGKTMRRWSVSEDDIVAALKVTR